MIFSPENIELIREGKKTETRKIWKKPHVKVGKTYQCRTSRYAKTPEDSPYIKITAMRKEKLRDITFEAAQREGVNDLSIFMGLWINLHGSWNPNQEVYVVDFEVIE